jgi:ribosomal silencing factor RsfS
MKPASFNDLPGSLQESFLWDMELDYDSYESSKAECIHMINVGADISSTNKMIIANYFKALSVETISARAVNIFKDIQRQELEMHNFLANL